MNQDNSRGGIVVKTEKILLVEDLAFFGNLIEKHYKRQPGVDVTWVRSLRDAELAIRKHPGFTLALVSLSLPDAPELSAVEAIKLKHRIPSIVFSSSYEKNTRDQLVRMGVLDYIVRESPASLQYLYNTVSRLTANRERTVLIVEDSASFRARLKKDLEDFHLNVIAAHDGEEALDIFNRRKDVSLVITDYVMPRMDGLKLTRALSRLSDQRRFAIIGISSHADMDTQIRFLKSGANDFLDKPFERERLYCRVSLNLDRLDQLEAIERSANIDELTGLKNRSFFMHTAGSKLAQAKRSGEGSALMLISVDDFRAINDTFGFECGDQLLVGVAKRLKERTRESDALARFSANSFGKLLVAPDPAFLEAIAATQLDAIGSTVFDTDSGQVAATISIGVAHAEIADLHQLIEVAQAALEQAKTIGGNTAVILSADGSRKEQVVSGAGELVKYY